MFITPAGNPASLDNSAIYKAVNGVCSAGFIITVLPVIQLKFDITGAVLGTLKFEFHKKIFDGLTKIFR